MKKGKLLTAVAIFSLIALSMFGDADSRSRIVWNESYAIAFADLTADSTWEVAQTVNLRNLRSYPLQITLRAQQASAAGGNNTQIAFIPSWESDGSDFDQLGTSTVPTECLVLSTIAGNSVAKTHIPWTSAANKDEKYHLLSFTVSSTAGDHDGRQHGYSNIGAFPYFHIVILTDRTAGLWTIEITGIGDL